MADLIGVGRCPIGCGSNKARYTLSAKDLVVGTCNTCNCQVFARSDRSDEKLRSNILPDASTEPAPAPAPAPAPVSKPEPEPVPVADPPPPPVKKKTIGWGMLAGREV